MPETASPAGSAGSNPSQQQPQLRQLGFGAYTCSLTWKAARSGQTRDLPFRDALSFLEHAHVCGAAGVQTALPATLHAEASRLRDRSESLGMYFEGEVVLPGAEADFPRFEADLRALQEAGATVVRSAALSGRRYENFRTPDQFTEFRQRALRSLEWAEPRLRRHRLRLALENHKDWLSDEIVELVRGLQSEWIGICVDTGNNLALLEDPVAVVEALAPFAASVHLKDMAVQETPEGFLLSEVPLGTGFLDLPRMVAALRRANPRIAFNLEMITRDPLVIPCLTPDYWPTLHRMSARQLAAAIRQVKAHPPKSPLPRITGLALADQLRLEDEHNRQSLAYAAAHLVG